MLSVYRLDEAEKWDTIVRSFRDYDVYWLSSYVKAYQIHGDGEPLLFFYDDVSTRGINVVMERDIAKAPGFHGVIEEEAYFDFSTPYGYGGWLIEGEKVEDLFRTYFSWLEDNGIICEVVRFHPLLNNHEACRDFYEIVCLGEVVHMDLSSPEEIWKNLTSENRNRIRKAINNNVHVYHDQSPDVYEQFRKIYNTTMDRNHAADYYYFEPSFYQSVSQDLAQNAQIFWAEKDGEFIAAAMMIYANDRLSFHLGGSLEEYNNLAPNNLIMVTAALWGAENGYRTLLLGGGVGSRGDTLLRYKKTFYRGRLNHFYLGKKIICPEKYNYLTSLRTQTDSRFFPLYRV